MMVCPRKLLETICWAMLQLTLQDLDSFCKMLEFGKFNDKWDVKIEGLGCKYFVSEVEKTAAWLA